MQNAKEQNYLKRCDKMTRRQYYSMRMGKNPHASKLDLIMLLKLFRELYVDYTKKGYFQEAFGDYCADAGETPGNLGSDLEAQVFLILRKENMWPISDKCMEYSEDDIFDIIEFIYDNISKPIKGSYHEYDGCWHYYKFDQNVGREEFKQKINEFLSDYQDGFELSDKGEILVAIEPGLNDLMGSDYSEYDSENIGSRINIAMLKFRRYRSSEDEKRDAIRNLADILEYLRPELKKVIIKNDESDLFNIANSFGIRHHNEHQRTDYDKSVWYDLSSRIY
jgi:hypothetical protein